MLQHNAMIIRKFHDIHMNYIEQFTPHNWQWRSWTYFQQPLACPLTKGCLMFQQQRRKHPYRHVAKSLKDLVWSLVLQFFYQPPVIHCKKVAFIKTQELKVVQIRVNPYSHIWHKTQVSAFLNNLQH